MSVYAHINNGVVVEMFSPPAGIPIADCFNAALTWVDVTARPSVVPGWTYNGTTFAAPVAPVAVPPTSIQALAFIQRFTQAEQVALMTANPVWGVLIAAAGTIQTDSALLIQQMQASVTAGALTAPRMAQILNLSIASP